MTDDEAHRGDSTNRVAARSFLIGNFFDIPGVVICWHQRQDQLKQERPVSLDAASSTMAPHSSRHKRKFMTLV